MSNIDIRALLGVPKHANQHRLSRLTMEVHTDELRIMASAVESYTDELIAALEAAEKRIAELERSETQLIEERDNAESALNDAYKAVMGQAPEWSNWFSFADAIDEIELACGLWRNQTDDVIQFRERIAELEAREVTLPAQKYCPGEYAGSVLWGETEVWNQAISECAKAIRAAGIGKGE